MKFLWFIWTLFHFDWSPLIIPVSSTSGHLQVNANSAPNARLPLIIHQTFKSANSSFSIYDPRFLSSIPENWVQARQSCLDKYIVPSALKTSDSKKQDWEYMFWTDENARSLISSEFPEHLHNFDSYPHGIERADVLRYFVLYKYGGIYLDLDIGCRSADGVDLRFLFQDLAEYQKQQNERKLKRSGTESSSSPLLNLAVFPATSPFGVSNDLMISTPEHPFFEFLISQLEAWNVNYGSKFLTVMFSTGPSFVDAQLMEYLNSQQQQKQNDLNNKSDILLLNDEWYTRLYFYHTQGSSWHGADARFFHWYHERTFEAVSITIIVVFGLSWIFRWFWIRFNKPLAKRERRQLPI